MGTPGFYFIYMFFFIHVEYVYNFQPLPKQDCSSQIDSNAILGIGTKEKLIFSQLEWKQMIH